MTAQYTCTGFMTPQSCKTPNCFTNQSSSHRPKMLKWHYIYITNVFSTVIHISIYRFAGVTLSHKYEMRQYMLKTRVQFKCLHIQYLFSHLYSVQPAFSYYRFSYVFSLYKYLHKEALGCVKFNSGHKYFPFQWIQVRVAKFSLEQPSAVYSRRRCTAGSYSW